MHATTCQKRLNTIVSIDLVGSTQLAASRGDAAFVELLTSLNKLYVDLMVLHDGTLRSTAGDSCLVQFSSPTDALDFSVSLLRELPRIRSQNSLSMPLDVRIGISTGETFAIGGNIAGVVVALAARLCRAAGDDGILVDEATAKLSEPGSRFQFVDRGKREIKGLGQRRVFVAKPPSM